MMDRKHGKYVVNIEHSEKQTPITCLNGQEAHPSACCHSQSNDTTSEIFHNVPQVCMDSELPSQSGCQCIQLSSTQVKGPCYNKWPQWKIFLTCFLACLITTAIGVLIICLVNSRTKGNFSIMINLPSNNGKPTTLVPETISATSQPKVTTTSTTTSTTTTTTAVTTTASNSSIQSTSTEDSPSSQAITVTLPTSIASSSSIQSTLATASPSSEATIVSTLITSTTFHSSSKSTTVA